MRLSGREVTIAVLAIALIAAGPGGVLGPAGASSQQTDCSFPVTVTDATGTEVTIQEEPETVVTLAPSAAQTMWEIGAEDKVIGVSKRAAYLDGTETRTNISGPGYTFVSVEKVVAENPDLVLAPNIIENQTVQKLRDAGLTVYRFEAASSLEDVTEKTLRIGEFTGECEGAQERVEEMEASIEVIRQAVEGEERPRVLYHLGGGFTAGSETFIGSIIETAGGTNVAAEAGITSYAQISSETVIEQDPQFIVHPDNARGSMFPAAYNRTTAVAEGNVVSVTDDYMNQPAPRTIQALETMVKAFHPEAYEAALAAQQTTTTGTETTPSETGTTETTPTPTTTSAPETTETESPGLGIVAVGVAVLLGTFIRRYR